MTKPSFSRQVGSVLQAAGFTKVKTYKWERRIGNYFDQIDIQVSMFFDSVAVNVTATDASIYEYLKDCTQSEWWNAPIHSRLGTLVSGFDKWWLRSDPEAPSQMAQQIQDYALPFLDGLHSHEGMKAFFETSRRSIKWRNVEAQVYHAVILARMGRLDDAFAMLADPPGRLKRTPDFLPRLEKIQARLRSDFAGAAEAKA